MESKMEYFQVLWAFLIVSAPYLLFGLLISGAIHELIPMEKVKKWLGAQKVSSIFKAAAIGVPLPLCSCSVIPTAVTLRKGGASNGATSAFLISTPESGIDSIAMTYGLMDLPMTIFRPVAAFVSAFLAGILQMLFNDFKLPESQMEQPKSCCGCGSQKKEAPNLVKRIKGVFGYGYGKLSDDIAVWLTIGLFLGALIEFVVPADFFTEMGMMQNRLMILAIGIPLYICASASTPIAVSLMLKGLSPGSAILFLLVGPATNISNIAVLQKYIGKKGVVINIVSIAAVALIFSFIVDYAYAEFFQIKLNEKLAHHHGEGATFVDQLLALALVVLLAKGIFKEKILPRLHSKEHASCH